jgi:FkbM family methyltransferase
MSPLPKEVLKESWLVLKTIGFSKTYVVEFNSHSVSFLTDTPYTKWWFHRNRRRGMRNGWHEPPVTFLLERLARVSSGFVDIGAHLGYFSILFASGAERRSLAIELDPANFAELKRGVAFQPTAIRQRIEVVHCGISDVGGTVYLPAAGSLSPSRSIAAAGRIEDRQAVEITTLDEILRSRRLAPDVVKIDVEGFEVKVLTGATDTISEFKPVLIIEIHPQELRKLNDEPSMVTRFLRNRGYMIFAFDDHRARGLSSQTEIDELTKRSNHDIVCIHKDDARRFALGECGWSVDAAPEPTGGSRP